MSLLISALVIILVGGLVAWLINAAPFLDERFKQIGVYVILVFVVIALVRLLWPGTIPL